MEMERKNIVDGPVGSMHAISIERRFLNRVKLARAGLAGLLGLSLALSASAGNLYWDANGTTAGVGGPSSGSAVWLGGSTWSTATAGTDAAPWINGSDAFFYGTIVPDITVNSTSTAPISVSSLNFYNPTTGTALTYTLRPPTGSPGLTFAGLAPSINLSNSTGFIYSNLASTNLVTVKKSADAVAGSVVINFYGQNSFDGGLEIVNAMRVNFNANGAAGIAGHAGAIRVDADGTILSTVGSLPLTVNSTFNVANNIQLNYTNLGGTFRTSLGSTNASPAVVTVNYTGQISGTADVVISNSTSGGGAGRTMFSNHNNNWVGQLIINNTNTFGGMILGATDVIPDASDVVFGRAEAGRLNAPLDMNGFSETVASISTNLSPTGVFAGITNTSNSTSTLTIAGMKGQDYIYKSVIGVASNSNPGFIAGNNKVALVLAATNNSAGALKLQGASTYTGGTTINGGVLYLDSGGSLASTGAMSLSSTGVFDLAGKTQQIGALSGTGGTIQSPAGTANLTTSFSSPSLSSYAGKITGSINLTKAGSGVLSLEGANDYTGTTTVSGGTLLINDNSAASSSVITVNSNATLGGIGATGGSVSISGGGIVAPGKTTAGQLAGTFSPNSLTLNPNSTLKFDLGSNATTYDKLNVTGGLSLVDSATKINIDIADLGGANPLSAGTYHLITYGSLSGSFSDLNLRSFPTTFGYQLQDIGTGVDLIVSALSTPKTWTGATTNWNTGSNWSATGVPSGDPVIFNDSAPNKTVTFTTDVAPGPMAFANNSDYTVGGTSANGITGIAPLTKSGTGKLTLTGTNTFTGPIAINNGTISVSSNANLGNAANALVINGATLESTGTFATARGITLNGPGTISATGGNTLTLNGVIGGASTLTVTGGGSVVLGSSDNSYQGSTTIGASTTLTTAANEVIPDTSDVILGTGATLNLAVFNETIGSLAGSAGSQVSIGSGKVLTAGGSDASTTFSGSIGGAGSLTKARAGTLTLAAANTFSGPVNVAGGALAVSNNNQLGGGTVVNIADGAGLAVETSSAAFSSARTINLNSSFAGGTSTLDVSGANGATFSGVVGGATSGQSGGLIKTGAGTVTFSNAANQFSGLTIAGGTVVANSDGTLGTGAITLSGGMLKTTAAITTGKALSSSSGIGGTIDTGANNLTINGMVTGQQNSTITKLGAGKLLLHTPVTLNSDTARFAWNILEGTVAVDAVTPIAFGTNVPPAGMSAVGIGGSTTATLFSNSITAKGAGTFEIDGIDLGQSTLGAPVAPRIYLDNGGTLLAAGTASYGRSDGAVYVVRGTNAATPSVVNLKTAALGAVTSPVFTIADPILQQENPFLQPYPVGAGTGSNVVIQVSGPGRVVLQNGNRFAPVSLGNLITNAQNFSGSWNIQSGILQVGPSIPNDQSQGFSADPLGEPLNALGYANNDPAQANSVLIAGGVLAVAVDGHNLNPNITDPYLNTSDPSIDTIRNPIALQGGAIASSGSEVSYITADGTGPQGVPTGVPVTAKFSGAFTVAASAANSKVLTYDPVDHSSLTDPFHTANQVRTVQLNGAGNTTWAGTLELDPGTTTGGAFNINRSAGGAVSVTPGAKIQIDSGANLRLNGVGVLSDGTNHVDILNNSAAGLKVETGAHAVGNIDGSGGTVISPAVASVPARLPATHIRQATLDIGAGSTVTIRNGPAAVTPAARATRAANTVSVVNTLANAGTLDLTDHDLIIKTGMLADAVTQILAGRSATPTGITSSAVTAKSSTMALGYMLNGTAGSPIKTAFDGQTLTGGEVIAAYVVQGDANLDGNVDGADFNLWFGHIGAMPTKEWALGDFNGDGNVDGGDYNIWFSHIGVPAIGDSAMPASDVSAIQNYADGVLAGTIAVPEPTTLGLLAIGATAMLCRRTRRSTKSIGR